jgi:hypothetical protein
MNPLRHAIVAFGLVVTTAACSSTPPLVDPLRDPALLPYAATTAVVQRPASLALVSVEDVRTADASERAVVDDRLALPVADVVRDYLRRELDHAGAFARAGDPATADLRLSVKVMGFGARLDDDWNSSDGAGRTVLRVALVRARDQKLLLDRTYAQEVAEKRVMLGSVDPVKLAGHSLSHVVALVHADLARLDVDVPSDAPIDPSVRPK